MTAELTFTPGRVPGIGQRAPRATIARRGLPHAAAPRSATPAATRAPWAAAPHTTPEDLAPGMTLAQRRALSALIHVPAGGGAARERAPGDGATAAWIAVLACAFAWTLAIVGELAPTTIATAAHRAAPLRTATPHVVETHSVA